MKEMGALAERWRVHHNTVRPHSSLGNRAPSPAAWLTEASYRHREVEVSEHFPLLYAPTTATRSANLLLRSINNPTEAKHVSVRSAFKKWFELTYISSKSLLCRLYLSLGPVQSRTISSMVLPVPILFGRSSKTHLSARLSAKESACFESVQIGREAFPALLILASVQSLFNFSPCNVNRRTPLRRALWTSSNSSCGTHVPRSQSMMDRSHARPRTAGSPCGDLPSRWLYESFRHSNWAPLEWPSSASLRSTPA